MKRYRFFIFFLCWAIGGAYAKPTSILLTANLYHVPTALVLRTLSEMTDHPLYVSAHVQSETTLHLDQLTFETLLQLICREQQLMSIDMHSFIYIMTLKDWLAEQDRDQKLHDHSPLESHVFRLHYAQAIKIFDLLKTPGKSLLSHQGRAIMDARTNTIIVYDHTQELQSIARAIRALDRAVPQVLIEAYIVNMDDDYEKALGIRWGVTGGHRLTGTLEGASEMASGKSLATVPVKQRMFVDLPAVGERAGHIGLALFHLAPGTLLDLELSALESEGHAEVISNPKLLTADQVPAQIEAGEEIPYEESVAQGVTTTAFKKAVLSLKVTPQITPDQKIMLHLQVNQDERSSKEVKGVPTINTRQMTTQVLLKDGETVVLGGIYEQTKTHDLDRVPFLSDIPLLGKLFQYQKTTNNKRELLIFVTPRVAT